MVTKRVEESDSESEWDEPHMQPFMSFVGFPRGFNPPTVMGPDMRLLSHYEQTPRYLYKVGDFDGKNRREVS